MMFLIETSDLRLRPLSIDDADQFVALCNDIDIARNTSRISRSYARDDADAFIERRGGDNFGAENEYVFAVCQHGKIVACAGSRQTQPGVCEIGYWVGADYRGCGIATASARAVTQFAFETMAAEKVTAGFFVDNPTSGRVLERVGFTKTGETEMLYSHGRECEVETIRVAVGRSQFQLCSEIVIRSAGS